MGTLIVHFGDARTLDEVRREAAASLKDRTITFSRLGDGGIDAAGRADDRSRLRGRTDRPTTVRRFRRAPRPLRLHRHLRAGPPHGRRGRLPQATCSSWSASWASPRCATPAATSSPATAGRTASARASGGPAGSTWPGTAPRPTRSAWTSSPRWADARSARSRCSPSTSAPAASRRRWTCWSTATSPAGTAPVRPAGRARRRGAASASGCGAWATRWTARGRSATRPPTSTAARRARPPGPCASSTRAWSWSPAAAPAPACRPSAHWERDRPGTRLRRRRLHLLPRLLRGARRRPGLLPGLGRRHGPLHRRGGRHRSTTSRAVKRSDQTRSTSRFDEWNVWYLRHHQLHETAHRDRRLAGGAPPARGRLHRRRRGGRRRPADLACCATPTGCRSPAWPSWSTSSPRS